MAHDTNILAEDCYWSKQCSVISSPNFPEAGLGLVNRKKHTIPRGTYFQYWGVVYLHRIADGNIMEDNELLIYISEIEQKQFLFEKIKLPFNNSIYLCNNNIFY